MNPKPLVGDLLHCALCSARYHPTPGQESQWRSVQFDGFVWVVCPEHFPAPDGTKFEFAAAYEFIIRRLMVRACRTPLH